MAVIRKWHRSFGQFLPNGSTPTKAAQNNTLTVTPGGAAQITSLRLRTDIELYLSITQTGSTDISIQPFMETLVAVGSILYTGGDQTSSQTPLTDPDAPPITGSLGGWGQWEYLYPTVDFVNVIAPQVALITWRPKGGTIDTQFRRVGPGPTGIDLFMPWEIQDGSGLINTTTSGVQYFLGARFAQSWLSEIVT